MIDWTELGRVAPAIVAVATRLLERNEVAFLATTSATGRPRLHPFVPRVVEGRLVAFVPEASPKYRDLLTRAHFAIHTLPGPEDEELFLAGSARCIDDARASRNAAAVAMGFATGVGEDHKLFEFLFDRALHTQWLDFGTPSHRPQRVRWRER